METLTSKGVTCFPHKSNKYRRYTMLKRTFMLYVVVLCVLICVQNSHLPPLYMPWSTCPSFSSPSFFSHANSGKSMSILHFSTLLFRPSFSCPSSSPSISTFVTSCVIFQSCIIHSCDLVRQLAVRHFPPLQLRPSFASPAFSSHVNSAHPSVIVKH